MMSFVVLQHLEDPRLSSLGLYGVTEVLQGFRQEPFPDLELLGIEPGAFCMPNACSATELWPFHFAQHRWATSQGWLRLPNSAQVACEGIVGLPSLSSTILLPSSPNSQDAQGL
ncbi:Hypothetical predicted protein [Podarcis lilfordi]|uniref:Uncharacterized protein n=1 Tax=Podarcis lilfordi TaxID=74358 RepID=A0AA35KNM7_9SAUR|nr:Hypothetical predicted protein [Podarcis lilfordi]